MNGAYVSNQGAYGPNSKFHDDGLPNPGVRQYKKDKRGGCCSCKTLCCSLCTCLLLLIAAIGIFALVAWLVLKPKSPQYNVTSVSIQDLTVTQGTSSSSGNSTVFLDSTLSLNLLTKNPNRVEINVKNSTVDLFFQTLQIGQAFIPAFTQGKNSEKNVTIAATVTNVDLLGESSNFLAAYNNNSVPLTTSSVIKGNVKIWGITSPEFKGTLKCNLNIDPQTRNLLSKSCSVSNVKLA